MTCQCMTPVCNLQPAMSITLVGTQHVHTVPVKNKSAVELRLHFPHQARKFETANSIRQRFAIYNVQGVYLSNTFVAGKFIINKACWLTIFECTTVKG